jgi:hypothetical protein
MDRQPINVPFTIKRRDPTRQKAPELDPVLAKSRGRKWVGRS